MINRNYILTIAFICMLPCSLVAQTAMFNTSLRQTLFLDDVYKGVDSIGEIKLKAYYSATFVLDTVENILIEEQNVLEIGEGISKYYSYRYFQYDSLMRNTEGKKYRSIKIASSILNSKTFPPSFYESYYINYPAGKITATGRIVATDFKYEEDIPIINWKILDSTKVIGGYLLQKAECAFRGRDYVAWFSPDVPISSGPWKFHGLPGLIFSIRDREGYYTFDLEKITNTEEGNIWIPKYMFIHTTRNKYLEAREKITANFPLYQNYYNAGNGIQISPAENYKKRALGNDFIERQ